ncbi:bifunctional proline dehydrogenase/L-glutamate gamma-semialdehyde dehydrogenase PutA [Amorphus sp. 3PC139-8]|uniref:bifunctional proline dehydrogenase/L-glutamate gamma-semialdehyde dehydrogenase PutA n=1 Tax=Amorphus sp. 3PC139-8 TaxID=2735676 RepID=UPI00345CE89A
MLFETSLAESGPLRQRFREDIRADETAIARRLIDAATLPADQVDRIAETARELVRGVRSGRIGRGGIDAFMHEYELSSKEGVVLMCLAEAMLRVPDAHTVDKLIEDKIGTAEWDSHLWKSDSFFVNASTWGLMLTGRVARLDDNEGRDARAVLGRLVHRAGEPVIRRAVREAMRILGRQFVMGRSIKEALSNAREAESEGYRHSYDMLGEAARTMADADRYFDSYANAIKEIGKASKTRSGMDAPGISVKLSALHPRYEFAKRERVMSELAPRLADLAVMAKDADIGFTVDAEEADRLDLSLDVIEAVAMDPRLKGWDGYGLAIQAYQKRCHALIDWLEDLAKRANRRLAVRLVKGAYWDSEIKWAQERGLPGYPVFTRKVLTDVSYIACAKKLLAADTAFYPQFATHNAHTVATILELAGNRQDFEFQRLHGMGEALYTQIVGEKALNRPCRIYAPVGTHEDLLAYLVRRLLENGANSSFVNRIQDEKLPIDAIVADPIHQARGLSSYPNPNIPLPQNLYGAARKNSQGLDLTDPAALAPVAERMERFAAYRWEGRPSVGGSPQEGTAREVRDPADHSRIIGTMTDATPELATKALERATRAFPAWDATPAGKRAEILEKAADLYEENLAELSAICVREAGKIMLDAVAEVREAVDFLRYYAHRARIDFAEPEAMPGPTGERDEYWLAGRGTFLCISPWNFPLAIFTGQVSAALAAGNSVLAKPAEQTPLVAARAVELLHQAGVPGDVLHLLPGDGAAIGGALLPDPRVSGVAFTGSVETAHIINRALAARDGAIVPLIAETGGQNAMIVDSTALPEQVVVDLCASAFQSAGQRCSAARVLFVQEDCADRTLTMLAGAMAELAIGDPSDLATDIGPVIDAEAKEALTAHIARMEKEAKLIARAPATAQMEKGTFVAPVAFEIDSLDRLKKEVFGPVLHVIRYKASRIDQVMDAINATGFGLTMGLHTRMDTEVEWLRRRAGAGNLYVNRNMIGAVVGVQPFGGEGLSGTGPKAGGPRYLSRFATERVISINTTAAGGNASLMSMGDDLPG